MIAYSKLVTFIEQLVIPQLENSKDYKFISEYRFSGLLHAGDRTFLRRAAMWATRACEADHFTDLDKLPIQMVSKYILTRAAVEIALDKMTEKLSKFIFMVPNATGPVEAKLFTTAVHNIADQYELTFQVTSQVEAWTIALTIYLVPEPIEGSYSTFHDWSLKLVLSAPVAVKNKSYPVTTKSLTTQIDNITIKVIKDLFSGYCFENRFFSMRGV